MAGEAAKIRKMPASAGVSFNSDKRSANLDAPWAPTWASKKAAPERPFGGPLFRSLSHSLGFTVNIIARKYHSVIESFY
jgi:hypothetical protein